ncbi:MAG: Glu-tRNA(Gln) amidotransferase subunit GatD [Methanobacteriota archaeon]
MSDDDFKGYKGQSRKLLEEKGAKVWSDVVVQSTRGVFKGIILPRSENADDRHVVLKLKTGYNVGVRVDSIKSIEIVGYKEAKYKIPEKEFPSDPKKGNVTLLGTGGTIASRLDYRTGAVIPAFSPGELYGAVPELADICNLKTIKLYGVFSENMGPDQWRGTAEAIGKEIQGGVSGICIGHGTDTMHHTSAILSFMVQNSPVPIVMVGSQRSSDRPSSDAAFNLVCATKTAAESDIAETMVCMYGPTSDQYCLLHRGTRVRKMHSSYRSTFRTIGDIPLATVSPTKGFTHLRDDYKRRRKDTDVTIDTKFDPKVGILYYYPNMQPDMVEHFIDKGYHGIVIAGTGLGHINKPLYEPIRRACEQGIAVYMTVQTLWGYVQMFVYDTGRDLMDIGIVPGANMLPEVAYMKMCWALGHTQEREELKKLMLTPIAGEITEREPPNGYIILQGGLPDVEEFVRKHLM